MHRVLILLPLPFIAVWVFYSGQNYEADELIMKSLESEIIFTLPRVERFTGPDNSRTYGDENLYEYVNGHAEFFISSGFVSLTVAEYKMGKEGEAIAEIYDMGRPENVLAVITSERGSARPIASLGDRAFISKGGLMIGKGSRFIRIGNFGLSDEDAVYLAKAISKSLASLNALEEASKDTVSAAADFLPAINMIANSEGFVKSDYLGLSFLVDIKTANYSFGGVESEGFHFPSRPDQMVAFFRDEGSKIETRSLGGLAIHKITDKYEGTINLISNGNDTVGIRGDIPKEGLDFFLNEAAGSLK